MNEDPKRTFLSFVSKDTLLPLGSIIVIASAIVWVVNVSNRAEMNSRDVSNLKADFQQHVRDGETQNERLIRIEEKVDAIQTNLTNK